MTPIRIAILVAASLLSGSYAILDSHGRILDYTSAPPAQLLCCSNPGGCVTPNTDGRCPEGKRLHICGDELICNDEGDACWYECALAPND